MLLSYFFFKHYLRVIYGIYTIYNSLNIFSKKNIIKIFVKKSLNFITIFQFFYSGYYFNEIYNSYIFHYRNLGTILFKNLDKGLIEGLFPLIIIKVINSFLSEVSKKNKGLIDHYVFIMILGLFSITIYIYYINYIIYDLKYFIILIVILLFTRIVK
jgi:NADH:ubiquinone oxidoreductase subunit 5 (subunit L)/multisubunit Na+/H+ antiporter MnhA subunit